MVALMLIAQGMKGEVVDRCSLKEEEEIEKGRQVDLNTSRRVYG
jgi:hypothetical protein